MAPAPSRLPRAVVFDLDGTLIDSAGDIATALNATLTGEGLREIPAGRVKTLVGGGSRRLIERALAELGEAEAPARVGRLTHIFERTYAADPCRATRIFPGATDLLDSLAARGVRLGLCTNKSGSITAPVLATLGLDNRFAGVVTGSDGLAKKPDAAMLAAVLARLGAKPANAVMVGDSTTDVACARAAGCRVVVVSFGYTDTPAAMLGADAVVERFDEIVPVLEHLFALRTAQ